MPLLIGTDEAGYGPNLGPLVITAVTWIVPDDVHPEDLPKLLNDIVTDHVDRTGQRLHIADSKQVYQAGKSLGGLEQGVLAFLRTMNARPGSLCELGDLLKSPDFQEGYAELFGKMDFADIPLPVTDCQNELDLKANRLTDALNRTQIQCERIESRVIFAEEFNQRVDVAGSKGVVLSEATLQLISNAVTAARSGPHRESAQSGWVICDKHGGRNRYDGLISDAFDDEFVFRVKESRERSIYRAADLEFCFRTKAEEVMPVALASMVSKYVRELTMKQFNLYWQSLIPDLKATKGYPVDAARFWDAIESTVERLQLDKRWIWRNR